MKTREQLIEEVKSFDLWTDYDFDYEKLVMLTDMIISVCEETIKESPEWAFENLKKLKSSKAIEEIKL